MTYACTCTTILFVFIYHDGRDTNLQRPERKYKNKRRKKKNLIKLNLAQNNWEYTPITSRGVFLYRPKPVSYLQYLLD